MSTRFVPHLGLVFSVGLATALALGSSTLSSCSEHDVTSATTASGGSATGQGGSFGGGGSGGFGGSVPSDYEDFPEEPIIDDGLPDDIADLFEGAVGSDTGGPCLAEPTLEAMVPRNWTPLYFEWQPPAEQNVFELRLSVENQVNDLVVYTTASSFAMSAQMWMWLSAHSAGLDVELSLRGATLEGGALTAGPLLGASGAIHLAPVDAPGSVVYWAASSGTSFDGFMIGDPSPVTVLTPTSAGTTSTGGETTCISCHTSSPDGELIVYSRDADDGTRAIDIRMVDGSGGPDPSVISPSALAMLGRHKQTVPLLSEAHYEADDAVALSVFIHPTHTLNLSEIIWTDLHATDENAWGILPRTPGDTRQATSPAWSRDGSRVAYVSSDTAGEGVIASGEMDVYVVPYNDKAGGSAEPLAGASEPDYEEFYPVYSPNDAWVAFNRHDQPLVNSYNQPAAEVFIVPGEGGTAVRLQANDPPTCTGLTSPGLTNSWPRWAPTAEEHGGLRYYWLVFSSKRRLAENANPGDPPIPQLYIAAVVTELDGQSETLVQDYPALYVRSQNPNENNHTPAWENFVVDEIPE